MIIKRLIIIFLVFSLMLIPGGCWDLTDINDHIFILGLGIDPDTEDGLYRFTFHYADPRGQNSDQSSDTMTYTNTVIRSTSLPLAVRELIRNSDSEANFEHLQTLVLGTDYLEMLSFDDIDMLFRMASVRRKCVVVTADIKASDLLSMKFSSVSTAVMINRLSNHYSSSNSNILEGFSLTSLYSKKVDNSSFYLFSLGAVENSNYTAISTTDQKKQKDISLSVTGISVFKNLKYAGRLGYPELDIVRLLLNRQTEGFINTVSENKANACYQIISSQCDKSCKIVDDKPVFTLKLNADCLLIESDDNFTDYGEELIEESLQEQISHIISLSKTSYGAELLGLETVLKRDCVKWFQNHSDYFEKGYRSSEIIVEIDCTVSSSGIIE